MSDPIAVPKSSQPVRVGLVGAGPWASVFTAPMLAGSADVELTGVWGRRPDAAAAVATPHGAAVAGSVDELIDGCDAVAFALPPNVQAEYAMRAARAGRAVLLDKPIGLTLDGARALADAIDDAGVVSQVVLTNRYLPAMREFLAAAAVFEAHGARAAFFGGGCMPGHFFGTPWRLEHGALLDLGPHVIDALDASLGTIEEISAVGRRLGTVLITCEHESGVVSQAAMSGTTPVDASGLFVELVGRAGALTLDVGQMDPAENRRQFDVAAQTIPAEFAAAVRSGRPHPLDVHRALHLQTLIERAGRTVD